MAISKIVNLQSYNVEETGFLGEAVEIDKINTAINESVLQLKQLQKSGGEFVEAHLLLLQDPSLTNETIALIKEEKIDAYRAFTKVINKYIDLMRLSNDAYLQDRYLDFVDLKMRVTHNLSKRSLTFSHFGECILSVEELVPSLVLSINKQVKGIISKNGGYTSHAAILCRSLGIPFSIASIPSDFSGIAIMNNEEIILNPSSDVIEQYKRQEVKEEPIVKDLKSIQLLANVSSNYDIEKVTKEFLGVGLYRTEFLMTPESIMSEEVQARIYKEALLRMNGRFITFRTFDIGDDKSVEFLPIKVKGVENYYKYPKLFETQIKALLLASRDYPNKVRIMFPMIESVSEYNDLKKQVVKAARELKVKVPPVGMMLETQMALINLKDFKNVDFISIGTNDLISEVFNMNRDQVTLYNNIYDDLLEIVRKVILFGEENKISVSICGEIISDVEFAKKAFSAGLKTCSITPSNINNIYKALNYNK